MQRKLGAVLLLILPLLISQLASAATTQKRYYAHDAVEDKLGVIAPWYTGQNGQIDYRIRIAAETMKRYPWTDTSRAVDAIPEYMFSSRWHISQDGTITIPGQSDWNNGDLGQRAATVLCAWVDYYRYSGDPVAIAHLTYMGDLLVDHCQTPADHPWPRCLISVPTKGKTYYDCDPKGHIQLDISSEVGQALLLAYEVVGNPRWLEAAKHWGDLLAEHCDKTPGAMPWPRYANPEDVTKWKDKNRETAGVAYHLYFLDELIRLGYTGKDDALVKARDAGRAYLRDTLLPKWTVNDTYGINYWDWADEVQAENVTQFACRYMMDNKAYFPNWRSDVRNAMSLFLNHTSVYATSGGEVYSGAWAYPESSGCCGRSLWYGPMEVSWAFAQYGVQADSEWAREIARRSQILATYDIHETGYSEDGIDGGPVVNGDWFKIAHPLALKHLLETTGWLPELFSPSRENHIVRSTSVVNDVRYLRGGVEYSTFDAPAGTTTVLRLAFMPKAVNADGKPLRLISKPDRNGYTVKVLGNADCIVTIRHDGTKRVSVTGDGTQRQVGDLKFPLKGSCEKGAEAVYEFEGNQVRLIGSVAPDGGLADVYLDGEKQRVGIDCWNPSPRGGQVLYYRNGLPGGKHALKVVARGEKSPSSNGAMVYLESVLCSNATGTTGFGEGGGPKDTQRMIFGYPNGTDYKDSQGNLWRPGTEFVVRLGFVIDSVKESWWTSPSTVAIANTDDPTLYRYGVHAPEFTVNATVGPGRYRVTLKFAAARGIDTKQNLVSVLINGRAVKEKMDIAALAGGQNKALDLSFGGISPRNGVIDIRFVGGDPVNKVGGEAFVQAIEVEPDND